MQRCNNLLLLLPLLLQLVRELLVMAAAVDAATGAPAVPPRLIISYDVQEPVHTVYRSQNAHTHGE